MRQLELGPLILADPGEFEFFCSGILIKSGRAARMSRNQPVIKAQAGNVLLIGCVVRNQGQVVNQSSGGNHQVGRGSGNPLP
jgi:hypothetical protein